jgi:protein SCO1/2
VDASYRLGLRIVAVTVVVAALACVLFLGLRPSRTPAARDLADAPNALGRFRLVERSGRPVTDADLAGRVWIASFIFTRCPASCPKITAVMKGLQGRLAGTGIQLVSLSVDPDHDSPSVLADYARRFGADAGRWWFLTGPKADVYEMILRRFHLPVEESSAADQAQGAEAVSHSARLALVDRGNRVVGYFSAGDAEDLRLLEGRARQLDGSWVRRLPAVNATLNGTAAVLLMLGWSLIRRGRVRAHATCMVLALTVSALFLACYLVYHYQVGSVPFRGVGPVRIVYFTILLSHTVLAVTIVPLVATTLMRAVRRQFAEHALIARITFPIWVYVSVTGVIIYFLLYQLDVPTSLV